MNRYKCPYINKEKAEAVGTEYFCDFDNMEFDSMQAHCKYCEIYHHILNLVRGALTNG